MHRPPQKGVFEDGEECIRRTSARTPASTNVSMMAVLLLENAMDYRKEGKLADLETVATHLKREGLL